jgi:hypothetical protein
MYLIKPLNDIWNNRRYSLENENIKKERLTRKRARAHGDKSHEKQTELQAVANTGIIRASNPIALRVERDIYKFG